MSTLWIADAFTTTPQSGNPAGVCIFDEFPADDWMQEVASKLGFSNSAFLKKLGPNHYHIRWFTPHSEAPICGHATVCAMHILITEKMVPSGTTVTFESMRGKLYVSHSETWYNLDFPAYEIELNKLDNQIQACVNITPTFVGKGNNIILMEIASEEEIYSLKPDLEAIKKLDCRALLITTRSSKYDFLLRYFAPKVGINEDPVCASAHCLLIPYWQKKLAKEEFTSYQASARGGLLKCKYLGNRVLISGEAVTVFKGNISDNNLSELKYVA
jgi:PhzF family phenazine biosynthesis protein